MGTNNFGQRMKMAMDNSGKKAVDVSRETGLSESLISGYLKGKYKPKQINTDIIATTLHVSPSWLMGLIDVEPESFSAPIGYDRLSADQKKLVQDFVDLLLKGEK